MGAIKMGIPEDELQGLVNDWRRANPSIVKFWRQVEADAKQFWRYILLAWRPRRHSA
jgi:DNA polymerase